MLTIFAVMLACPSLVASGMSVGNQPRPVPRARWSEDWSMLRDIAPMRDTAPPASAGFWRPIKYIPLNESGDSYLSFGGEYRLAYELYDKADAGISAIGRQDAVQHRMALHADLHLNPQWRIFGQLGYALVNGRDGGAKAVDETDVDIWRACLPVISLKMRVAKTAIISISDLISCSEQVQRMAGRNWIEGV